MVLTWVGIVMAEFCAELWLRPLPRGGIPTACTVIRGGILFISTYPAIAAPRRNKVSQSWMVTLMNHGALQSILCSRKG